MANGNENGNGFKNILSWPMAAAMFLGVAGGGASGTYFGQTTLTREEVSDIVSSSAPYVHDKASIQSRLDRLEADYITLNERQSDIIAELAAANAKLDILLNRIGGEGE